jgi:hypothetical protein
VAAETLIRQDWSNISAKIDQLLATGRADRIVAACSDCQHHYGKPRRT